MSFLNFFFKDDKDSKVETANEIAAVKGSFEDTFDEELAKEDIDFPEDGGPDDKHSKESSNAKNAKPIQPYSSYPNCGVKFSETKNNFSLSYDGILAKSGADTIYAVVGFGDNSKWEDVRYFPMEQVDSNTFKSQIPIKRTGNINVAFRDSANNWDNNSGKNYTFVSKTNEGSY